MSRTCKACNGKGQLPPKSIFAFLFNVDRTCQECGGTGMAIDKPWVSDLQDLVALVNKNQIICHEDELRIYAKIENIANNLVRREKIAVDNIDDFKLATKDCEVTELRPGSIPLYDRDPTFTGEILACSNKDNILRIEGERLFIPINEYTTEELKDAIFALRQKLRANAEILVIVYMYPDKYIHPEVGSYGIVSKAGLIDPMALKN